MSLPFLLIALVIVGVIYFVATYNGFIILKTRIQEALSGIDVQLKRRTDLIPNLVETLRVMQSMKKVYLKMSLKLVQP
jgi:LemA protein